MNRSLKLVLFGSSILLTAGSVHAQEMVSAAAGTSSAPAAPSAPGAPETQSMSQLGEVVVTAQKRSERIRDVPMSITAQTGDQLLKAGVTSPGDLQKVVPGFIFSPSAYGSPIYSIRGVGFYDDAMAISPAVSVYVDQVPLPFPRMTEGATLDIERVEALKGPQGTLFGQNSTGGAINYIAAKPTDTFHWGGEAGYGRFDAFDAQGYMSGPLTDTLNARLALRTEQRGDWQESDSRPGDGLGARHFFTGRLLLDWHPTDRLKFELNVNGWRDTSDTEAQQFVRYVPEAVGGNQAGVINGVVIPNLQSLIAATPPAPDNARAADWVPPVKFVPNLRRNDGFYQTALRTDYAITDNINLTALTAYADLTVYNPADVDGTPYLNDVAILAGELKSFSQEIRLAGSTDERRLKWMVGLNYENDDTKEIHDDIINGTNTAVGPLIFDDIAFSNNQHIQTQSVFGSLDYDATSKLTLQASGRFQNQSRSFEGCLYDPGKSMPFGLPGGDGLFAVAFGTLSNLLSGQNNPYPYGKCVTLDPVTNLPTDIHSSTTDNDFSWRVGASYKLVPGTMVYANISRGYKAASYGTLPFLRPDQANPVPPEQLTAYEVGFKSDLFDRQLSLTGALFYYDYINKQLRGYLQTGVPFGAVTALLSIPTSRVEGAELDANWMPITGLTLNVGATYVDSAVTGGALMQPSPLGNLINVSGMAFPNTPKWQVVASGEYDYPITDQHNLFFGGDVTYHSTTDAFFENTDDFTLKGYALLDMRAGIAARDGRWRVELWGDNVTNAFYLVHAEKVVDTVTRSPGMPVTYGIRLSAKY